jgi:hypothetical protein
VTFLRNELCSNNLTDFGLKKGLDHLDAVRTKFQAITDRFAGFQAQWLNVHVDFPLLQRIALPITVGAVRYPGIKIHDVRVIRLFEVLLHGGTHVGGWTAKEIHAAVLATFHLSERAYGLNQLRYDLRKLKGHGLIERDGSRYAYRLTAKGVQVALLFLLFHKRPWKCRTAPRQSLQCASWVGNCQPQHNSICNRAFSARQNCACARNNPLLGRPGQATAAWRLEPRGRAVPVLAHLRDTAPPILRQLTGELRLSPGLSRTDFCGQSAVLCPRRSHVHLFGDSEGIVNLDAEIAHGRFNLGMAEQKLHCP